MRKFCLLLFLLHACGYLTQAQDTAALKAASYFRGADSASRNQHLWKQQLYGPMLLVDPQSRVAYADQQDSAGIFKQVAPNVYKGLLPKEVLVANTAIRWQGRLWSVILWPLPLNSNDRLNLLMHESFHRVQQDLGLPAHSPTIDHLAIMDGRIYFMLELQALKAALGKPTGQCIEDLTNALLFREKRQQLFPSSFANERILEMNEGLAEYTGVLLGIPKDSIRRHLYREIDRAAVRPSLIRSMAYITGPVYGYLLYKKSPTWTHSVDSNSSFPALIKKYYKVSLPKNVEGNAFYRLEQKYNGDSIIRSEKVKEESRMQQAQVYTRLFTQQPVLTIKLIKMNMEFNPNTLFDLGPHGTVYPTAQIKDVWGKLTVTSEGMLLKDWQVITLSASDEISVNGRSIEGKGWRIELNEQWQLKKLDPQQFTLINVGSSK